MAIQKVEVPTSAERIIAVDGPTAAGKTTVCRRVSDRFGLAFIETGRVYRYLALMAVRRRLDPSDSERMLALHNSVNGNYFRALNSGGLDQKLRSPDVSEAVAILATLPVVRAALTDVVRSWACDKDWCIVEGRDIGTVVFPGAKIKLYLDAALDVRVKRRESDWQTVAVRDVREHVSWRDSMDSTRSSSPLQVAKEAIVIDSTSMTLGEVVDRVSMICADIIGRR